MTKVKCKVCVNIAGNLCSIKKVSVSPNKNRNCEAFVYDKSKVMPKKELNTIKVSYADIERAKAKRKAEIKTIRELAKKAPNQGTSKQLGLIDEQERKIILPGEKNFSLPRVDLKHPLTGDLSRFTTTASKSEE